ncbi:hypothetical protein T10_1101 [Trichinella papuae]|uniref:Uncharacterized protein n=1 Tax=Trichinella papuae TaxID=268474 RepID=A0A0V1N9C9_9BILA|nr:hypothetical protein T10_1101 [Trichinella papuae]
MLSFLEFGLAFIELGRVSVSRKSISSVLLSADIGVANSASRPQLYISPTRVPSQLSDQSKPTTVFICLCQQAVLQIKISDSLTSVITPYPRKKRLLKVIHEQRTAIARLI